MTGQLSLDRLATPRELTRAELLTASQVAEILGVPLSTVREWERNGTLPRVRLGRHVRFIRTLVEAAIFDAEERRSHRAHPAVDDLVLTGARSSRRGVPILAQCPRGCVPRTHWAVLISTGFVGAAATVAWPVVGTVAPDGARDRRDPVRCDRIARRR